MSRTLSRLALASALALAPARAQGALERAGEPAVVMELLSEVSHATPGAHFQLAVRLRVPEGWSIGGEQAGAQGVATTLELAGPEGYAIGEVLYPGPQRVGAGGALGYAGEVCLLVPVEVPADAAVGSKAAFRAVGRWLVRGEASFRQTGSAELALPVATRVDNSVPMPAHPQLFKHWRQRLPRPQAELAGARAEWSLGEAGAHELQLCVEGAREVEFLPDDASVLELAEARDLEASAEGAGTRLVFRPCADPRPIARGVLRVSRPGAERFYRFAAVAPVRAE